MVTEIIKRSLILNIKILAITDHDSLSGYRIAKEYISKNKIDLLLIPGCEITTTEGHVLAYGITKEIQPKLTAQKTIDLVHKQNGVAIVAHPFYINSTGQKLFDLKPDAIEGLNAAVSMKANREAISAANKMTLPYTASSDAHEIDAIGHGCTIFPSNTKTVTDVLNCLKTGNFAIEHQDTPYFEIGKAHLKNFVKRLLSGKIFEPMSQEAIRIFELEK
jgi:predicted metal-dependent phosphoesterase TrpH